MTKILPIITIFLIVAIAQCYCGYSNGAYDGGYRPAKHYYGKNNYDHSPRYEKIYKYGKVNNYDDSARYGANNQYGDSYYGKNTYDNSYYEKNSYGNHYGTVQAPIHSDHDVYYKQYPSYVRRRPVPPTVISSDAMPMDIVFKTQSSDLKVSQQHVNNGPKTQYSQSIDGAVVLKHDVKRPVMQYVNEVIVPTRYLTQQVLPVKEYVKTIVPKQHSHLYPAPEPMPEPEYYN